MYRFAVLPYANALPLTYFIRYVCPQAELIERKPYQMLTELEQGRVDAALLSVVDFLGHDDLKMVTNLGIAAHGRVQSVLLQCQRPLEQVEKVALDPESRTANALAQILFAKHFLAAREVNFVDDARSAEAVVVIGDRALRPERAFESYDLAEEWRLMSGLGFVFAVWAYRQDYPDPQGLRRILLAAKQTGLRHLSYLAELSAERLGLSVARCRYYLSSCIRYELGASELGGMKLFAELLKDSVLADRAKVLEEAVE